MKIIINAYMLFKKQLSSNFIIIIFFALFCSVSVYLYNEYNQRIVCYSMFNNSDYNMIYTNVPMNIISNPSNLQYVDLYNGLQEQAKDIDGYISTSKTFETYVKINDENSKDEKFTIMYMIDSITSKALKYKLKQGKWLSEARTYNEMIPCIIGGNNSKNYEIGDVLNISFFKENNVNDEYTRDETQCTKYYVAGIFKDKQQFFNTSVLSSSSPQPLSYYLNYAEDTELYIWAQHDLSYSQAECIMDYNINSVPIMYFNKSLSREAIDGAMKKINITSLFSHYDLMSEEKLKIVKDYEFILPSLFILAIVSIVGIYSMCLLNIFKNYKMFSIFYLCGCTKRKNIILIGTYSLFFMVFTLMIVGLIYSIFVYLIKIQNPYISQYIYMDLKHIVGIILLCFLVSFFSFITPFILLRKMSVAKQLTVE